MANTIIKGDLTQNIMNHVGDLIIEGNVQDKVKISIKDGALHVKGSVGKDVTIDQSQTPESFGNIIITNNSCSVSIIDRVIRINGQRVDGMQDKKETSSLKYGCQIDGVCNTNAFIMGSSVKIGYMKDGYVKAQSTCEAADISGTEISAGSSITIGKAYNSQLDAGNSLNAVALISTKAEAGNSVKVSGDIEGGSVRAGNSIHAGNAKFAKLSAGNSIKAEVLFGCSYRAGNKVAAQIINPNSDRAR